MTLARGTPCLARLEGAWTDAVVRCSHEDGTFSVDQPGQRSVVMSGWHGLGDADVSVDDAAAWDALAGGRAVDGTLAADDVGGLFAGVGVEIDPMAVEAWWDQSGQRLFGDSVDRRPTADVYRMIRGAGWCARALDPARPSPPWVPLWWNQVRMGGRDPGEVGPIGVAEAADALGLGPDDDPDAVAALDAVEATHGVRLPAELRALAARAGFAEAFRQSHCNSPEWVAPADWEVVRDLRSAGLEGDVAVVFAEPHQGEHAWMLVFDGGEAVGTVYTRHPTPDGPLCLLTAPSLAFFLWDLASASAAWAAALGVPPAA